MAIPGVEAGSGRLHPRHRLPQGTWGQDKVQLSRTPCIVVSNNDIVQAEARGSPWCGGLGSGEAGAAAEGVEGDQARHLHRHMPQDGPLR